MTIEAAGSRRPWTLLSNHGHVLVYLARHPDPVMREIAAGVGITERAAQGIVHDLAEYGYITIHRVGRRNSYTINTALPLRHPDEADHTVGELLATFTEPLPPSAAGATA